MPLIGACDQGIRCPAFAALDCIAVTTGPTPGCGSDCPRRAALGWPPVNRWWGLNIALLMLLSGGRPERCTTGHVRHRRAARSGALSGGHDPGGSLVDGAACRPHRGKRSPAGCILVGNAARILSHRWRPMRHRRSRLIRTPRRILPGWPGSAPRLAGASRWPFFTCARPCESSTVAAKSRAALRMMGVAQRMVERRCFFP